MKLVAVVALFVAVLSFGTSVAAQCADYAGCVGQVAEGGARLREFQRATAVVVATDRAIARAATSEAQRMNATATELARPTQTPQPTNTAQPTATPQPSATRQPVPTATQAPVVAQAPVQPVETKQIDWRSLIAMAFAGSILIGGALYFLKRL